MDKSWMQNRDRLSQEYEQGVKEFLDFAFAQTEVGKLIPCPCVKCNNSLLKTRESVEEDLIVHGIIKTYTQWFMHGEQQKELSSYENEESNDDSYGDSMDDILEAHFGAPNIDDWIDDESVMHESEEPNDEAAKFFRLLKDASEKLYPHCERFSKLSFIVKLFHLKCLNHWSNRSFTMLLELLGDVFPKGHTLPKSYYEANKIIQDLGLHYEKIDACKNDCMLYWNENSNANCCTTCGVSRWKIDGSDGKSKKVPYKTLWYFPITTRLQRLFMSENLASEMTWHHDKRVDDEILRHPADSQAWKHFNMLHKSFAKDPRNVILGLASDGFNPFSSMSSRYSIWPVMLVPYNLPPWLCMKQPYCMLSLLIPGPNAPGNNIDVYMQPLIDELKMLWEEGVTTYDAFRKQNFQMHAAVLWTINDFPAYGNLSGWVNRGTLACPCCNKETHSRRLKYGGKECYMGHRRFLPIKHRWRSQWWLFDGTKEMNHPPKQLFGYDVLDQLRYLHFLPFGKEEKKRKRDKLQCTNGWKKKSIFFQLPYWQTLLVRHNLDVMHIEKNVCDNVLGTLMNIEGKSKDNLKARFDLKDMGIREALHPIPMGDKVVIPSACYTLSSNEKKALCEFLTKIKVPDGYASNISKCVRLSDRKILGLKSHDSHVLMEQFLPIAIRGLLTKEVREALIELSIFFKELCCRVLKIDDLNRLESQIPITLCKLEMIFPPSFFDIMVHLSIHLASEAKIAGPVQYRWMYPIERYMRTLKGYVRNKSRPKGSIAKGYLADECSTFCSRYLHNIDTKFNGVGRNNEGRESNLSGGGLSICRNVGRPLKRGKDIKILPLNEWLQARLYVLNYCEEVRPFIETYQKELEGNGVQNVEATINLKFPEWFENQVMQLRQEDHEQINDHLFSLAQGPSQIVTCYDAYLINGFRFYTQSHTIKGNTQNSGVVVKGEHVMGTCDYYGVLAEIVELDYMGKVKVVLFKCDWWDVHSNKGVVTDAYGFVSVNKNRKLKTNEPYVIACQCEQVYYIEDIKDANWLVVIKTEPRDFYNIPMQANEIDEQENINNMEPYQQNEASSHLVNANMDENVLPIHWQRDDIPEYVVDANVVLEHTMANEVYDSDNSNESDFVMSED